MKHISYALLTALLASTSVQAAVTYDKLDQWIDKHAQCFACHDDGEAMKKWLVDHKDESEQLSSLAPLIHQYHFRAGRALGTCTMCHGDGEKAHWKIDLDKNNCMVCHDFSKLESHKAFEKREDCQGCHSAKATGDVHTARYKKERAEAQKAIGRVTIEDAKLVPVDADARRVDLTLRVEDREGRLLGTDDPAIDFLTVYANWGARTGFVSAKGVKVDAKTAHAGSDGLWRVSSDPLPVKDKDTAGETGVASAVFGYCFDDAAKLVACTDKNARRNTAWTASVNFDTEGLDALSRSPRIVSNEKCGSCHGYDKTSDRTKIRCGTCHAAGTKAAAGASRHVSGNDGTPAFMKRELGLDSILVEQNTSAMSDLATCVTCHNSSAAPAAVVRNRLVEKNDPHFVDELVVSHPDWKVFAHAHHGNFRAVQTQTEGVRHVTYVATLSNCAKCHEGETYTLERLNRLGDKAELLAIDTKVDPDNKDRKAPATTPDRYATPMAATCYACHAKVVVGGKALWNEKAKEHILEMGGLLGAEVDPKTVKPENCASCHDAANLKAVHGEAPKAPTAVYKE